MTNPPITAASLDWAKLPRSLSTNRTLRCATLFCVDRHKRLLLLLLFVVVVVVVVVVLVLVLLLVLLLVLVLVLVSAKYDMGVVSPLGHF
jgi:hypothetical protein